MRRGQVWLETVIYTLIGISVISLVLVFVLPKINQAKEKKLVDQNINIINEIYDKMLDTYLSGSGNRRSITFVLNNGNLFFDSLNNITFINISNLNYPFSEKDMVIPYGKVYVLTTKKGDKYNVEIYKNLSFGLDLGENQKIKEIVPSSVPQKVIFENIGDNRIKIYLG